MDKHISILSARFISDDKWQEKVTCIYELMPFIEKKSPFLFFLKFLNRTYKYLNKFKFVIGIKLFINRKKYDIIISNSIEQALIFSFLSLIFGKKRNIHIFNEIYFQFPTSFRHKIRPFIFKLFVNKINFIRVSSKNEIKHYSKLLNIKENKFWFLPYPTPIQEPYFSFEDEGYILSSGKQYRDYDTLVKAVDGLGLKTIIVSDYNSMNKVKPCDETTVYYNITKSQYIDLLMKAKIVVIPLNNDFCSCGQIALLEAMSYGKSVIVARVTGTIDYIEDGSTGLFYEMGNYSDLRNKILNLYRNDNLRYKLANNALKYIKKNLTYNVFVQRYLQFIENKWNEF